MEEISRGLQSGTSQSSSILQLISNQYNKILTGSQDERESGLKMMWTYLGSADSVLVAQVNNQYKLWPIKVFRQKGPSILEFANPNGLPRTHFKS